MKRSQRGDMDGVVGVLFMIIVACGYVIFANWSCKAQAHIMGMNSTWGPVQGCMIEVKQGKWAPMERYRVPD
jgi:hypothetical protein